MSKHFFGEREVQKLHKSCQNGTKLSQNAVYPDGEAVYRPAQDQVNHVKSMYIFCIQTHFSEQLKHLQWYTFLRTKWYSL